MNLNDIIQFAHILKESDASKLQGTSKEVLRLGLGHLKLFMDNCYDCLTSTDIELAISLGKEVLVPQSLVKIKAKLIAYDDGEICLKPYGIVFVGKGKNGKQSTFLFHTNNVERYTTGQYTNLIVRINSCKKNSEEDKAEMRKIMNCYVEVWKTLHKAAQVLINLLRHLLQRGDC